MSAGISRARSGSVASPSRARVEVGLDIVRSTGKFRVVGQQGFEALALAHQRLRTCGVGPNGGVGGLLFDDG